MKAQTLIRRVRETGGQYFSRENMRVLAPVLYDIEPLDTADRTGRRFNAFLFIESTRGIDWQDTGERLYGVTAIHLYPDGALAYHKLPGAYTLDEARTTRDDASTAEWLAALGFTRIA